MSDQFMPNDIFVREWKLVQFVAGRNPTVSDAEILHFIAVAPDPFVVASELKEEMDMTRQGVLKRLDKLHESGLLNRKETNTVNVYWLSSEGRQYLNEHQGNS